MIHIDLNLRWYISGYICWLVWYGMQSVCAVCSEPRLQWSFSINLSEHCQKHLGSWYIWFWIDFLVVVCLETLLLLFTSSSHIQLCCPYELKTYSVRRWGLEYNLFWWMFGHVAKIILNSFLLPSLPSDPPVPFGQIEELSWRLCWPDTGGPGSCAVPVWTLID